MDNKIYSFTIGRFQPLHGGHIKLIRTVLDEGKNICVALRDTEVDESNPYSIEERIEMFKKEFATEINNTTLKITVIPNISEVFYGRKVGWRVREIALDKTTENISATKIRKENQKKI